MKKSMISLGLFGALILVANLSFSQDAPSVSTNTETNSVNSASSPGSNW
ncbi:MAG: hypothetical protein HQL12_01305 [Candidatus Omnitrophica bacterium]|nr:hypothetical protein [Candidatus Omnitrophota bacterium]